MVGRKSSNRRKSDTAFNALLDAEATPPLIRRLVSCGVIPPSLFIKALVLARDNSFLRKYGLLLLSLASFIYIAGGLLLFLASKWQDIPFSFRLIAASSCLIFAVVAAAVKGVANKSGAFFLFLGFIFGGLLLYLSMNNQVASVPLWQFLAVWFVLITPWVFLAKSVFLAVFWFLSGVFGLLAWGLQEALPTGLLSWPEFFSLSACAAVAVLVLREVPLLYKKQKWLDSPFTRLVPLGVSLILALFPIFTHIIGLKGEAFTSSTVILLLLVSLSLIVYYRILPDYKALMVIIYACCTFFLGVVMREYFYYNDEWYFIFVIIIAAFGFSSWLAARIKGKMETL